MNYPALLGELDQWFDRGVADAGAGVVLCRRGCCACCFGPFDVSPADARQVAAAVGLLDASAQAAVRSRAHHQRSRYRTLAPSWTAPWDVDAIGDLAFDQLADALHSVPCPALGEQGTCLIYDDRPATCRITGLAMQTVERDVLDNVCPILDTSAAFAALKPTLFDLSRFEDAADSCDAEAQAAGWVRSTVAGALGNET